MKKIFLSTIFSTSCLFSFSHLHAQNRNDLEASYLPGTALKNKNPENKTPSSPGTSINVPTGHSAHFRDVFLGIGLVDRVRYGSYSDAAFSLGAGIGHSKKNIAATISLGFFDVFEKPFQRFSVSAKVSRHLFHNAYLAIGANDVLSVNTGGFRLTSFYGALSERVNFNRESPWLTHLSGTLGLGNGHYREENTVNQQILNGSHKWKFGTFAALALGIHERVNLIGNWNAQNLDVGLSVAPLKFHNLILTGALLDLIEPANGDGIRMSLSIGYGYHF